MSDTWIGGTLWDKVKVEQVESNGCLEWGVRKLRVPLSPFLLSSTGPGARWPRPSPGPPGGHRGQAGTAGPEGGGRAL